MQFDSVARLASAADNAGIATRFLEQGQVITFQGADLVLSFSILEGHRFAVQPIAKGEFILSWGVPFGKALRDIEPGEYLTNDKSLVEMRIRSIDFELPEAPNFEDYTPKVEVRPEEMVASPPLERLASPGTFQGYAHPAGFGTRNYVGVLAVNALASGFCRALAGRFKGREADFSNLDGVVPVDHTEGGESKQALNHGLVVRTLAGFTRHPNLGAVLLVEPEGGSVGAREILDAIPDEIRKGLCVEVLSLSEGFEKGLNKGASIIDGWLPGLEKRERVAAPLSALKLALQCGGSDAFSGISGNPLAGRVARTLIQHGGSANLAETTELIGAEAYVLSKVRSPEVARGFLDMVNRYQELASFHGHSAEGNPSGGNLYRGLYNIVIKSIGAAMKKDPEVPLDFILEYGQLMEHPGFYFMDSAGNDLESIAGQVASGCNLIHFITGNGSITNFPFVPTIKLVTTTSRHELLRAEMDVNAGRYLDGESMEDLAEKVFELSCSVASGKRVVGELAGHSQVQLWRAWRQSCPTNVEDILGRTIPDGVGLRPKPEIEVSGELQETIRTNLFTGEPFALASGLILPTSLCSGQIASMIASGITGDTGRCVALPHTEGCGTARGHAEDLFGLTLTGYLSHPLVNRALLLEHGCEKTHNDEFRRRLREEGLDPSRFGYASIQADGGIEAVTRKVRDWFGSVEAVDHARPYQLGWILNGEPSAEEWTTLKEMVAGIVRQGGSVVFPLFENSVTQELAKKLGVPLKASLGFARSPVGAGVHFMEMFSESTDEALTALGAGGCHLVLVSTEVRHQGHPLVPTLVMNQGQTDRDWADFRACATAEEIVSMMGQVLSGSLEPLAWKHQDVFFQVTRGPLGISL